MRLILKKIYFLPFFLILVSCNNQETNSVSLNSLINPEYSFTQDFFYCNLDDSSSLINLESFLSSFVSNYENELKNLLNVNILFPDNTGDIKSFILSIRSNKNPQDVKRLIDLLEIEEFDNISTCTFSIRQLSGLDMISSLKNDDNEFINIEILRCNYNKNYNYGTFRIAIDRFINAVERLKLSYSSSYINSSDLYNEFIWINSFPMNDYEEFLKKTWIIGDESKAIKDEFNENTTCLDSKKYKSYRLI